MKLYYDSLEDPRFGHIVFGASDKGLRIVGFGRFAGLIAVFEHACNYKLKAEENSQKTKKIGGQLAEFLQGKRNSFDIDFDFNYLPPFKRKALQTALKIPYGKVITYGQLAKKVGSPKAARAAGQAMATNPMPLVIPCHRVVGSDGHLTGYSGGDGIALKKLLLEMEGVSMRGMRAVLK